MRAGHSTGLPAGGGPGPADKACEGRSFHGAPGWWGPGTGGQGM